MLVLDETERHHRGRRPTGRQKVRPWFKGAGCLDVAQYEVLGIAAALEGNARPLPYGAVRTVATDQKSRTDPFLNTGQGVR